MPRLIDELLPVYDVREFHNVFVHSSPERTYAAIGSVDLAQARLVRVLEAIRVLPAALRAGRRGMRNLVARRHEPMRIHALARGFRVVAERPPEEIVIGVEGRFWRLDGNINDLPAEGFATPLAPGTARAAWNFAVRPIGVGRVELSTETRVYCADAAARRRFIPYWLLIRPASGVMRRLMLREIKRAAERDTDVMASDNPTAAGGRQWAERSR